MKDRQKTVRVEVRFSGGGVAARIMALASQVPGLLMNILRGRVTPDGAVYELEITGPVARIRRAVARLKSAAAV
mgnify:CR=1 FL=1